MMVDLGSLPPEVSSGLIYSGPGSSSMMAAASAWNGLAAELNSAALGYDKVVTTLTGEEWLGPASASMAASVQPYITWMTTTATQVEQAAVQAQSAAAHFENVLREVVPPPLIAANRMELVQAQQTNVLGLNNGVIAQLEAQYSEFWAQNAAALYSYAGQSAIATKVTPYTSAPSIVSPAATAEQGTAVAAAQSNPAGSVQQTLQGYMTKIQGSLASLASPAASTASTYPRATEIWYLLTAQKELPKNLADILAGYTPYAGFFYNTEGLPYFSIGIGNFFTQIAKSSGALSGPASAAAAVPKSLPALGG
ncbi:MAG: PPE family protein, partial [Mycobacterium sp.]